MVTSYAFQNNEIFVVCTITPSVKKITVIVKRKKEEYIYISWLLRLKSAGNDCAYY